MRSQFIVRTISFAAALTASLAAVGAHAQTWWDAYNQFSTTENTSSSPWQYSQVTAGSNTSYTLLPTYYFGDNPPAWRNSSGSVPAVWTNGGQVVVHPYLDGATAVAAAIGWRSPDSQTVNATFSVADADVGDSTDNGVDYWLFKEGNPIALASGYVAKGGATGYITAWNISVSVGDKLYLQIGPHYVDNVSNYYFDATAVTLTVAPWDAYNQFSTTENTGGSLWQYSQVTAGNNTGYSLLPAYYSGDNPPAWRNSSGSVPAVWKDGSTLRLLMHPSIIDEMAIAAAIAWQSPIYGTVNVTFSAADVDVGDSTDNGVDYWLYQEGNPIALSSGYVAKGGATGYITVSNVAVTPGDKLYLQIGPHFVSSASDYYFDATMVTFTVNGTVNDVSHGRQVILDRGLQLMSLGPYFDTTQWAAADFTSFNYEWVAFCDCLGMVPSGTSWARHWPLGDPDFLLTSAELPYVDSLTAMHYSDECSDIMTASRQTDMYAKYRIWNHRYPNALAFSNCLAALPATVADLVTYMQNTKPDMLMFDYYPPYDLADPYRVYMYDVMQRYRTASLQGYDGTGTRPIACGQWQRLFRSSYTAPLPSESFVRFQQFASWAFGFTFLETYVYVDHNEPASAPVMFASPGCTQPTPVFNYVATANHESRNLGPALIRLKSSDVRMIVGSGLSLPTSVSAWSSGTGCPKLTGIARRSGVNRDILIGYFAPLKAVNSDYPWVNQTATTWHFMVVNAASGTPTAFDAPGDPASASAATIRLTFTGVPSTKTPHLEKISRSTGSVTTVTLTRVTSTSYRVDIAFTGGTGELLKFYY